jgi:hypothetical protein
MTVEIELPSRQPDGTGAGVSRVGHRSSWTANGAVIQATAPSLPILFDECGMALADLTGETDSGAPACSWEAVDLEAADLAELASKWVDELMRRAGDHRGELVDVAVDVVAAPGRGTGDAWRLHGRIGLRWLFGRHGPARHDLRSRTSHCVKSSEGTWTLLARLQPVRDPSSVHDDQRPQPGDRSELAGSLGDADDLGHASVRERRRGWSVVEAAEPRAAAPDADPGCRMPAVGVGTR